MKNINKELFSLILIVTSGILILGLAIVIIYAISLVWRMDYGAWYVLGYLPLCAIMFMVSKRSKNPVVNFLFRVIALPLRMITGFIPVALPYFVLQIHLFIYLFVSAALPLSFFVLDRITKVSDLKITTYIYLIVTFSVITATMMNKQVKHLTYLFSPMRLYRTNIAKRLEFNQLTDYFLSENNIKFIIYFCYFLYLLIFNLFTFQEHSFYSSPLIDRAILQSFITFLALERLLSNLEELDFKPSGMLKLLLSSITGDTKGDKNKKLMGS
jgi:hypothetical protein